MATTEGGHATNRFYIDQDGQAHLNGSSLYLDESGTAFSGSEAAFTDGVTAGTALASKALVLDASMNVVGQLDKVTTSQGTGAVTAAQSCTTFSCSVDAVITLPLVATANKGCRFRFITGAASSGTGLSISPNSADYIYGVGLNSGLTTNKDIINSGATDRVGDILEIISLGSGGWLITTAIGIWARET